MSVKRFSNITLAIMLAATVGFTLLVTLWLSTPEQRTQQFWISISVLVFCEILSFGYAMYFNTSGGEARHPVPSIFGIGSAIAIYVVSALAICVVFWLIFSVSLKWYVILHCGAVLMFVLLGGASLMFLRTSGNVESSDKQGRANILGLQVVLSDAVHEMASLSPSGSIQKALTLLNELQEMVRFSDPNTPPSLKAQDAEISNAVNALLGSIRKFKGSPSDEAGSLMEGEIREVMHKIKQRNKLVAANK